MLNQCEHDLCFNQELPFVATLVLITLIIDVVKIIIIITINFIAIVAIVATDFTITNGCWLTQKGEKRYFERIDGKLQSQELGI